MPSAARDVGHHMTIDVVHDEDGASIELESRRARAPPAAGARAAASPRRRAAPDSASSRAGPGNLAAVARRAAIVAGDAKGDAEQPGPDRPARVVDLEVAKDDHEDVVAEILDVAILHAETAQRVPHVAELSGVDGRELDSRQRRRQWRPVRSHEDIGHRPAIRHAHRVDSASAEAVGDRRSSDKPFVDARFRRRARCGSAGAITSTWMSTARTRLTGSSSSTRAPERPVRHPRRARREDIPSPPPPGRRRRRARRRRRCDGRRTARGTPPSSRR